MQLECVALEGGELLVDVTDHDNLSEVLDELSKKWTWDAQEGPVVHPPEEEDTESTEWLVLINARPKAEPAAA